MHSLKVRFFLIFSLFILQLTTIAQDNAIKKLHQRLQNNSLTADSSATIYRQLTRLYAKKLAYVQAIDVAQKEANIRRRMRQKQKLAEVYFNIASLHRTIAAYNQALKWGQKALKIYEKQFGTKHTESLSMYRFLAQTQYLRQEYSLATSLAQKALKGYLNLSQQQPKAEINLHILLGSIHIQNAAYTKAYKAYWQAKELYFQFESKLSKELLARIYTNLASLKFQQKAILEALAYHQEVVQIRQTLRHENHFTLQTTYTNIGLCYYQLNEFDKALSYHRKSLAIINQTYGSKHDLVAFLHNHIGATFQHLGKYDSAHYHLQKAIHICESLFGKHSPQGLAPLWRLAKLHRKEGNLDQARLLLEQAIRIQKTHLGNSHPDLAKMYLDMVYIFQEKKQFTKASWYVDLAYQANLFNNQILDQPLMLKVIEAQLGISLQLPIEKQEKAFTLLDRIEFILAQTQAKLNYATDKQNLIQGFRKVCEHGIALCYQLSQHQPKKAYSEKAFQLMEYNKAVLLSTQIKQNHAQSSSNDSIYLEQEQRLRHIRFLEQKWKKAEYQQDSIKVLALQQELFNQHRLYEQFIETHKTTRQLYYHSPIQLFSLQKQLNHQQVAINYFYGQNNIYILQIEHKNVVFLQVDLSLQKDLSQFSNYLLDLERSKLKLSNSCQLFEKAAFALYQILIPQPSKKEVLIIPDGQLNYIPFEALTTQVKNKTTGYHQLQYAVYQHTFSYAYSATSYYYQQYKHLNHSNVKMLAFAPSYGELFKLPTLQANIAEVKFLEQQFKGSFYYNKAAKKKQFQVQSPQFGILHLASHGYADNHELQQAKLFFSDDSNDSLTATLYPHEITQIPLKADFIVLSACQTAIGYWQKGEGIMSLARDFMYAGVPSILTTLWQINDRSSSLIIQDFYLALETFPKHIALKIAKENYLKKASSFSAHPFFWSGYILIGNTNRVNIAATNSINLWYLVVSCLFFSIIFLSIIRHKLY